MTLNKVLSLSLGTLTLIGSSLLGLQEAKAVTFDFNFNLDPYPGGSTSLTGTFTTSGIVDEGLANAITLDNLPDWSFEFIYQGSAGERILTASDANPGTLIDPTSDIQVYTDGGNLLFNDLDGSFINFNNGSELVAFLEQTSDLEDVNFTYDGILGTQNPGTFYTATATATATVPEPTSPQTLLGLGVALGLGSLFKRQLSK